MFTQSAFAALETTLRIGLGQARRDQPAAARGVDLVGPIPGREPASEPGALTVDDFAVDERTGQVEAWPSGHAPLVVERDQAAGTTRIEMAAEICGGCPFCDACPIHPYPPGTYGPLASDEIVADVGGWRTLSLKEPTDEEKE